MSWQASQRDDIKPGDDESRDLKVALSRAVTLALMVGKISVEDGLKLLDIDKETLAGLYDHMKMTNEQAITLQAAKIIYTEKFKKDGLFS